ncbi:hypothetical protein ZWY2020_041679 [Hordeum vulgare]|nr:hypothetical protein ZWY2020_041679 [Hordeum vulgare]
MTRFGISTRFNATSSVVSEAASASSGAVHAVPRTEPVVSAEWLHANLRDPDVKLHVSLEGGMFGMRASGTAASWVVGWMGTDAHLYDDPEDAAILALLDSRFDAHL